LRDLAFPVHALDPPSYGESARVSRETIGPEYWEAHYTWNDDFTFMLGLTPTGRATIVAFQLNRRGLVNWRRVLYGIGEHPPGLNTVNPA